jgi:hypothetical protein
MSYAAPAVNLRSSSSWSPAVVAPRAPTFQRNMPPPYAGAPITPLEVSTPMAFLNEGLPVTEQNMPYIFRKQREAQVMQVNQQRSAGGSDSPPRQSGGSPLRGHVAEHVFGSGWQEELQTTSVELQRIQIQTVRHLQRALQSKIVQGTRTKGRWASMYGIFQKLDRSKTGSLNLGDLQAACEMYNLHAPEELVSTLLHALDTDRDGVLSLSEFVQGLSCDGTQLQAPQGDVISSRRHFRTIKFHHPCAAAPRPTRAAAPAPPARPSATAAPLPRADAFLRRRAGSTTFSHDRGQPCRSPSVRTACITASRLGGAS